MNPQEDRLFFFFGGVAAAMSSLQVTSQQPCHARPLIPRPSGATLKEGRAGIYGCGMLVLILLSAGVHIISLRNCCRPFGAVFSSRECGNLKQ
jgi:hypothetical protein